MLTEQRFDIILKLLEEKKSVTVTELRELLDASESTVRRDITALDKAGKLTKVFGGAVALNHKVTAYEPTVAQKSELNKEEKKKIAKYAASLITPDDFVYLDAGTTTGLMLEYLAGVRAAFVTNAVSHAQTLAKMGIRVYLIGGELKSSTEAVVGSQAMQMIQMYHFTKGFFGTKCRTLVWNRYYGKRFVCQSIGRRMLFYFYRCFLFCYERNSRSGSWRIGRLLWRKN